jgi:catechol-2,3-dioxygenase
MAGVGVSGASHVSFSVSDFDRSLRWYREVFGAEVMLDEPAERRRAAVLRLPGTDLLIGICQFHERQDSAFDPTHVGLDHFAFSVATRDDLDVWAVRLDELGIGHSGAIDVPPGAILNFKDPDGIALALMWRR